VINASLLGVVREAGKHDAIESLYGARFGIDGILAEDFVDLSIQPRELVEAVSRTPSSALGSSRREVTKEDLQRLLAIFERHNIRYLFYNGGNGSMGTAWQIAKLARDRGVPLQVIGIPKTIDNDLVETDHTPGYASVARFFATAVRDIDADNRALRNQVEIVEVLGRNAGWLVAATSLARVKDDDGPHLIYLPENKLPLHKFLTDVETVYRRFNRCVVAVCEGQLDEAGEPFGADVRGGSRGALAMNLGHRLAMLISQNLKLRARSEKPGLLARASSLTITDSDWREAYDVGRFAVASAVQGETGKMVTLIRSSETPYEVTYGLVDLQKVAFIERIVPANWITSEKNGVTNEFQAYALPLVGEIPALPRLN
jgi:ATP-dependent phosphofructokinase / diphosphate-dependent phosphofructokinase